MLNLLHYRNADIGSAVDDLRHGRLVDDLRIVTVPGPIDSGSFNFPSLAPNFPTAFTKILVKFVVKFWKTGNNTLPWPGRQNRTSRELLLAWPIDPHRKNFAIKLVDRVGVG